MKDEDEKPVKRTTIILDEEERKYIDQLIREGKEPGIKPLISKMLDIYRSMTIYDWQYPGEYYCGVSRIAFINAELISVLLQYIPKEKFWEVGRKAGEVLRVSLEASLNIRATERKDWPNVFKRIRVQGFGDVYLRDKYIVVKSPFIESFEVWGGLLEGLLGVRLDAKTVSAPFIFEIVEAGD